MLLRYGRPLGRRGVAAPSVVALVLAELSIALLPTRVEAAGGAFVVDDSSITPTHTCQVESWTSFAANRDFADVVSPICTVEFITPIEFTAQTQRAGAAGVWDTLVTFQAKINPVPVETGKVGFAVSGATILDLATHQNAGAYVNVPVTFAILETFRANVNVGWLYHRVSDLHWFTWGASVEWDIVKQLTMLVEVFGQSGHTPLDEPSLREPRMQAGLRFTPVDNVDVDVIYGHNVTGVRTNWITLGLTVRFDGPGKPPK